MDRLTCPLIEFGCRRERCAWWDGKNQTCAVLTTMHTLNDIKEALTRTEDPEKQK